MRVVIDELLCEGHALCMGIAPDIFEVGDDDLARVLVDEVPAGRQDDVRNAVRSCPKQAISIQE
ncbi:MAG TPA: ferredoxin [Acidimicrobiales bacterium]|nr:ferredoxin [Acidimicrobiales bacterium]